jgi:hypothetical protein
MLLRGMTEDKDVINIGKTKWQIHKDFIHKALESLSCIAKAEGHERKFKKAKRSSNGCLLNIIRMDWDLVVCPY